MLFYSIDVRKTKQAENESEKWEKKYRSASEDVFKECEGNAFIAVSRVTEFKATLIMALCHDKAGQYTVERVVEKFNNVSGSDFAIKDVEEITLNKFLSAIHAAYMNNNIDDDDEITKHFNIERHAYCCYDCIAREMERDEIEQISRETLYDKSFLPEIERIYAMKNNCDDMFHPVHYIIKSDDARDDSEVIEALINALHKNNRLKSRRYSVIELSPEMNSIDIQKCYAQQSGGTVVARLQQDEDEGDLLRSGNTLYYLKRLASMLQKGSEHTLTIIVLPINCEAYIDVLYKKCKTAFVEIEPENAVGEVAKRYLSYKAQKINAEPDENLFNDLRSDRAMCRWELRAMFDTWHTNYMIEKKYPLYKDVKVKPAPKVEETFGKAAKELEDMIGLETAKGVINSAVDYYKVQKIYKTFNKSTHRPSMHMVFTGNPGSAKTTVARLFAQILKDNDVITSGKLVEVGRADLVGKYVGHTAPKVKDAFEKAKGGVLFIDEAYSLVDDHDNLYGDEAINTIVQEMENRRGDTIVIFAGYPDKMEEFLNRNPGLRSRIAFNVPFDDYSTDELMAIAHLMAKKRENVFAEGCDAVLGRIFDNAAKSKDFGNGRFVRNVMESAEMQRASRIAKMDAGLVRENDLDIFMPEDFEAACGLNKEVVSKKIIGFTLDGK